MENTMKMYVTADEAAQILGVSRGYAYKIIRRGEVGTTQVRDSQGGIHTPPSGGFI